jgi:tRNA 2-thiouridine synthesizing protein A
VAVAITPHSVLDCSGMSCPMPILKTRKAIDGLATGQVLKVLATDPGSVPDIEAFARKTGHTLLDKEQQEGKYIFYLRKK